ncbi:bacillithiol system redox-active protein YtxJ [soil metagenome]
MKWSKLESLDQIEGIKETSKKTPVLIFKHSTSCSISRTSLDRLERNWKQEEMDVVESFFLDLLSHRDVSNQIAREFSVEHQSPQILLIENGVSVYDRSHFDINYQELRDEVKNQKPEIRSRKQD